jgi:hypothetical protein
MTSATLVDSGFLKEWDAEDRLRSGRAVEGCWLR